MKNVLILLVGIVIGVGLAGLWSRSASPGGEWTESVQGGQLEAADSTESVIVNGRVIQTRGSSSEKLVGEESGETRGVEQVRMNGRIIQTRSEPSEEGAGGEQGRSGDRRGKQNLRRDYRQRNADRQDELPVDPGVAERILKVLGQGAEAFGGAAVPPG